MEIGEDTINVKMDNQKQIVFTKAEITGIEELQDRSLRIKTSDKRKAVVIPVRLDGFLEVKELLAQWSPIQPGGRATNHIWTILLSLLELTAISGSFLIVSLIWCFILIQRSKVYEQKVKQMSWYILLVWRIHLDVHN